MKGQKTLFSSLTDSWATPKAYHDKLNREFSFNHDPCPLNGQLGFFEPWKERNFINPPYSEVARWIKKAWVESLKGKLCVLLVAARTSSKWFHEYVLPHAKEIRFIKGRLYFTNKNGKRGPAPFPSMVVIFDGRTYVKPYITLNRHALKY